jgi:hypothetical protein
MTIYSDIWHPNAMDPTIYHSHSRTMNLALLNGHKARYIDDDCALITFNDDRDDWVQIVFDRFSSTAKFSSATDSNGNVYRSYLGVRKLIEAKS